MRVLTTDALLLGVCIKLHKCRFMGVCMTRALYLGSVLGPRKGASFLQEPY